MASINQLGDAGFTGVADVARGDTPGCQFRLQAYVLERDRTGLTAGAAGPDEADGYEDHMARLRETRLGSTAPHHQPPARAAALSRLAAAFVSEDNQRYLTEALQRAARPAGVSAGQVQKLAPEWVRAFARRLREVPLGPPGGELAAANRAFMADRLAFMRTHHYLARDQAAGDARWDDPARFQATEFNSIYWDANRALSAPAGRDTGLARLPERDTREPPLTISRAPAFPSPSRYDRGAGAGRPQANARQAWARDQDRDRNLEVWQALQERTDRKPTVIRGRPLRYFAREDRSELAGAPELGANPAIGGHFGRGIADRMTAAAQETARWRALRENYYAPPAPAARRAHTFTDAALV